MWIQLECLPYCGCGCAQGDYQSTKFETPNKIRQIIMVVMIKHRTHVDWHVQPYNCTILGGFSLKMSAWMGKWNGSLICAHLIRQSWTPPISSLQWRHNERDGASNQPPQDFLLNRLFKAQIKENSKASRHWPLCGEFTGERGIHRWPVNSPHKGPLTRKMFPFDDVIMRRINVLGMFENDPRNNRGHESANGDCRCATLVNT